MQGRMAARRGSAATAKITTRLGISAAYGRRAGIAELPLRHRNMFVAFRSSSLGLTYIHRQPQGRPLVDRALNLNLLAAFAAFMFVGAVLLGAF
jgi:hypothetical protein